MDANKRKILELQVQRTISALKKNRMDATFINSASEVVPMVTSLLSKGETVSVGGSATLSETGVLDLLRNGNYTFLDRYRKGITADELEKLFRDTFFADSYLASANAITEHGEIYCVDGRANRVSAMLYGPQQVILVVSWDKIVPDLASAVVRVKREAAPANTIRLNSGTYCSEQGKCINPNCDDHHLMALAAGACEHTICSNYVIFSRQQIEGRIKVIIVGESLGY